MSLVMYELRFYIQEDDILHSHRRENLKSYRLAVYWAELSKFHLKTETESSPR
jgi:hypothetical protein